MLEKLAINHPDRILLVDANSLGTFLPGLFFDCAPRGHLIGGGGLGQRSEISPLRKYSKLAELLGSGCA
jgi:hypothetical protein